MCSGYSSVVSGANSFSFAASTATADPFHNSCCDAKTCFGGVIWTEVFEVQAGETKEVYYEYEASNGGDWYEAAIVLYASFLAVGSEPSLGYLSSNVLQVNLRRGATVPMGEETFGTPVGAGRYFIAFYLASYDASNGGALGARMEVSGLGARAP